MEDDYRYGKRNSPATLRRGDAEEAVALDPVHDLVLEDGRDDDAGAGEGGEEREEECCCLHLVLSSFFLFFPLFLLRMFFFFRFSYLPAVASLKVNFSGVLKLSSDNVKMGFDRPAVCQCKWGVRLEISSKVKELICK